MTRKADAPYNDAPVIDNLALLAFNIMEVGAMAGIEKFEDFFSDDFQDSTGVDAASSDNEVYVTASKKWGGLWYQGLWNDTYNSSPTCFGTGERCIGLLFTPSVNKTVASVKLNISVATGPQQLTARVYVNNAGSPGAQQNGDSTPGTPGGTGAFTLSWASNNPVLTGGTAYWIVISTVSVWTAGAVDSVNDAAGYGSGRADTYGALTDTLGSGREWRFQINYTTTYFSVQSNVVTAEANDPSKMFGVFLVDLNALSLTVNTEIIGYISINGGTNFETLALAYQGLDGTGRAIYSASVSPTPRTAKNLVVKAQFTKDVYLKAWALLWKY